MCLCRFSPVHSACALWCFGICNLGCLLVWEILVTVFPYSLDTNSIVLFYWVTNNSLNLTEFLSLEINQGLVRDRQVLYHGARSPVLFFTF